MRHLCTAVSLLGVTGIPSVGCSGDAPGTDRVESTSSRLAAEVAGQTQGSTSEVVIEPSSDTRAYRWLPGRNYGSKATITIDGLSIPDSARTLLRFDVSRLRDQLQGKGIVRAILELEPKLPAITWGEPRAAVHKMKQPWSEQDATWGNVFGFFTQPFEQEATDAMGLDRARS